MSGPHYPPKPVRDPRPCVRCRGPMTACVHHASIGEARGPLCCRCFCAESPRRPEPVVRAPIPAFLASWGGWAR